MLKQRDSIPPEKIAEYERAQGRIAEQFDDYSRQYIDGEISSEELEDLMQGDLEDYYTQLAELGKGEELTTTDRREIAAALVLTYIYLGNFRGDLDDPDQILSDNKVSWRSALYSLGWDRFMQYAVPSDLATMLPEFPGISCLGGSACGCTLEWEIGATEAHVWWVVNPEKDHCSVCVSLEAAWNPFIVEFEF